MSECIYGGGRRRRRVGRPRLRRRRRRHGGSWLGDKISQAHNWIKKNKLVSTVANALGSVGVPYAGTLGTVAQKLGYGKNRRVRRRRVAGGRRRVYRRRRGGNMLSKVHSFVKSNRLISKGIRHFLPNSNLHKAAYSLGYGAGGGSNLTQQIAMPKF